MKEVTLSRCACGVGWVAVQQQISIATIEKRIDIYIFVLSHLNSFALLLLCSCTLVLFCSCTLLLFYSCTLLLFYSFTHLIFRTLPFLSQLQIVQVLRMTSFFKSNFFNTLMPYLIVSAAVRILIEHFYIILCFKLFILC